MSMFRIRIVSDDLYPMNQSAITQVVELVKAQNHNQYFSIENLGERLRNIQKSRVRTWLLVAEDLKGNVKGAAVLSHWSDLQFFFLEHLVASKDILVSGIGGALYERVRELAEKLKLLGVFVECESDMLPSSNENEVPEEVKAKLRFFERFGARPIENPDYGHLQKLFGSSGKLLLYDKLDAAKLPNMLVVQKMLTSLLPQLFENVDTEVLNGFFEKTAGQDFRIRESQYLKAKIESEESGSGNSSKNVIYLAVNDKHSIQHLRERGYAEAPVRIDGILKEIEKISVFERIQVAKFPEKHIREVHADDMVDYLKTASESLGPDDSLYPSVFPVRYPERKPRDLNVASGYYCIDTLTPLTSNVFPAARGAVDSVLSCASKILEGHHIAYALLRPPGHHAERKVFGGFCYFNSSAIAAHYLSKFGKVAVLDIDFHHGNGQQDIFYERNDVLTISIHGNPAYAYPYFSGFKDETGTGEGLGYNFNFPMPENTTGKSYRLVLGECLKIIERFKPSYVVVPFGLDVGKGDPTGNWNMGAKDFEYNGKMIGSLRLPTLVVQEGGYHNRLTGVNAAHFFKGLFESSYNERIPKYE